MKMKPVTHRIVIVLWTLLVVCTLIALLVRVSDLIGEKETFTNSSWAEIGADTASEQLIQAYAAGRMPLEADRDFARRVRYGSLAIPAGFSVTLRRDYNRFANDISEGFAVFLALAFAAGIVQYLLTGILSPARLFRGAPQTASSPD